MTLVSAAVVPTPPLLVPEVAGGSAALDEGLRAACAAAWTAATPSGVTATCGLSSGVPGQTATDSIVMPAHVARTRAARPR